MKLTPRGCALLNCIDCLQEAFRAFHNDLGFVKKYMKAIHLGQLETDEKKTEDIQEDFEELRQTAHKMVGLKSQRELFIIIKLSTIMI